MLIYITDQPRGEPKELQKLDTASTTHVKAESLVKSYSVHFMKGNRAPGSELHTVVFAIKKKEIAKLTKMLEDISNPFSANYGKHLKKHQVTDLTSNLEGSNKLLHFLENHPLATNGGVIEILKMTPNKDYITARAPVELWEHFFNTEFFLFHRKQDNKGMIPSFELN